MKPSIWMRIWSPNKAFTPLSHRCLVHKQFLSPPNMRQCLWITYVPSGFTYAAILYYVKLCLRIHEGSPLIPSSFHLTRIHVVLLREMTAFFKHFFYFLFFLQKTFLSIIEATCVKEPTEPGREIRTSEEKKERVEINLLAITVLKRACFCICVSAVVQRRQFEWRNMSCLRCMYLTGWGNQDHVFEAARNKEGVDYYTLFTSSISWADTFSFISAQRRTCTLDSWTSRAFLSKSGGFFVAKIWDNALDKEFVFCCCFCCVVFLGGFLGVFFWHAPWFKILHTSSLRWNLRQMNAVQSGLHQRALEGKGTIF